MIQHDGAISTQSSGYADFWAAHRDRAGPLTPADVWGLREDREFVPPSKGHLRRLRRVRPTVTAARPVVVDDTARREVLARAKRGREVLAACGCERVIHVAKPLPYERPAPIEPGAARITADHAERRAAAIFAEAARIASYGDRELGRAWSLFKTI